MRAPFLTIVVKHEEEIRSRQGWRMGSVGLAHESRRGIMGAQLTVPAGGVRESLVIAATFGTLSSARHSDERSFEKSEVFP